MVCVHVCGMKVREEHRSTCINVLHRRGLVSPCDVETKEKNMLRNEKGLPLIIEILQKNQKIHE